MADNWSCWMIFFEKIIIFKNVGEMVFGGRVRTGEGLFMRQVGVKQTFVVVVSFLAANGFF